jgi:hypothetical protein
LELARPHTVKKVVPDEAVDPLLAEDGDWSELMRRNEQDMIDRIIHGEESGHYFMLIGPKVCRPHLMQYSRKSFAHCPYIYFDRVQGRAQ